MQRRSALHPRFGGPLRLLLLVVTFTTLSLLQAPLPIQATGFGSPSECLHPGLRVGTAGAVVVAAPPGEEVDYICVRGLVSFRPRGHSNPIAHDGTYGAGLGTGCYAVSGVGTSELRVVNPSQTTRCRFTGLIDRFTGHVDVFFRAAPAPNEPPNVDAGPGSTVTLPDAATLDGSVSDDGLPAPPSLVTTWSVSSGPGTVTFGDDASVDTTATFSEPGVYILRLTADDGEFAPFDEVEITVEAGASPPGLVPSVLSNTAATDVGAATEFLYTGDDPIQTGVEPGAIQRERTAVVHGLVFHRDTGEPLPGVAISVLDHPEWGQTISRADGRFDMAMDGDGYQVMVYRIAGFVEAQRQVLVQPQQFRMAPDVALTPLDVATVVDLSAPGTKVARGSVESDEDGTRRATLLFPDGITAELQTPGGPLPISTLTIHLTEFTVGENGPIGMPAELPPASKYTYALEFSADEEGPASATGVSFSQPLPFYIENFLEFPIGTVAPLGYYDRQLAVWVPLESGIVLKIVSVTDGMADIDVDGDDVADDVLAARGITDDERSSLATLYAPGQELWRVLIPHFTPMDINWAREALADLVDQVVQFLDGILPPKDCTECNGSVVEVENQVLGESIGLTGVPASLHYSSARVLAESQLAITVTGPVVPGNLVRVNVTVNVGGEITRMSFPPSPSQIWTFEWDGIDGYGRHLLGGQYATVSIENVFEEGYMATTEFGGVPVPFGVIGNPVATRASGHITKQFTVPIAAPWPANGSSLGGWTFDQHHQYDPGAQTVYLGNGDRIKEADELGPVRDTATGLGTVPPHTAVPGFTRASELTAQIHAVVAAPGGGFWAASGSWFLRIDSAGIVTYVRNTLGGPIQDLDVGPRGELYIALQAQRILKYDPRLGTLTTFAGTGSECTVELSGPAVATAWALCAFPDIAAAPDGNVYIADNHYLHIYRVRTDGIIEPFALMSPYCGIGVAFWQGGWCEWDVPAYSAQAWSGGPIWAGPDGALYLAGGTARNGITARIGPDGILRRFIGSGTGEGWTELEGVPPTHTNAFFEAFGISPSGRVVYLHRGGDRDIGGGVRLRTIVGGVTVNLAGNGFQGLDGNGENDGLPAELMPLAGSSGNIAFLDDGSILFPEAGLIRVLHSTYQGFGDLSDHFIASPDGGEIWHFDGVGRHIETLHALTGAVLWSFGYDAAGRLLTMTDGDGNVTTVARDGSGRPVSITGPFGDVTTVTVDANGYLQSVTNPAGETVTLAHSANGLLASMTTPRGFTHEYGFNGDRMLLTDDDPAGGGQTLDRAALPETSIRRTGHEVSRTTALGRITTTTIEYMKDGRRLQSTTAPDGTTAISEHANGSAKYASPAGVIATTLEAPDPRFGEQAPLSQASVTNPGGLTRTTSEARNVSLSDPNDVFSIVTLNDTLTVNGHQYSSVYDGATRTFTSTTPMGRTSTLTIDQLGRPVAATAPGLADSSVTYDGRGRIITAASGAPGPDQRAATFTYDARNFLATVTDPEGRTVGFKYDGAGRVITQVLPDLREVGFTYDGDGDLTSVTTPAGAVHTFAFNELGQPVSYTPPVVAGVPSPTTTYEYNVDHQLVTETRPDGLTTELSYDSAGRLASLTFSRGAITLTYDAVTGQLTSIAAPGGEVLSYDYLGELLAGITWAGTVSGSVGHTFDNDFRLASQSVNSGNSVSFDYDDDSLLVTAGDLALAHDATNGLLTGSTLNTITDAYTYSMFAEVEAYEASASGTPFYSTSYTRDDIGRINQKVETLDGVITTYDYTYDTAGRLIAVSVDGSAAAAYTYDANGNRLSGPGVEAGVYDAQDRMLTYGGNSYAYTANGELTAKTNGGETTTYTYDEPGNLVAAELPSGDRIEYVIDGEQRRVGKKVNGALLQGWLYDGSLAIVAELDGSGALVSRFVYATGVNVPDYLVQDGVIYRIITDHLGSLRLVVRASDGHVVQRMNHDEFGRVTEDFVEAGFIRVPFGFAGGLYDQDTGLVRFGARDYDAESGRWTAKDPIGFNGGQTNVYAYVASEPVHHGDPAGLQDAATGQKSKVECKCKFVRSLLKGSLPYDLAEYDLKFGANFGPFAALASLTLKQPDTGWESTFEYKSEPFADGVSAFVYRHFTGSGLAMTALWLAPPNLRAGGMVTRFIAGYVIGYCAGDAAISTGKALGRGVGPYQVVTDQHGIPMIILR